MSRENMMSHRDVTQIALLWKVEVGSCTPPDTTEPDITPQHEKHILRCDSKIYRKKTARDVVRFVERTTTSPPLLKNGIPRTKSPYWDLILYIGLATIDMKMRLSTGRSQKVDVLPDREFWNI